MAMKTDPAPFAKSSAPVLRIGIIVDNSISYKHVYNFVEWANKHGQLCVSHVIVIQPIKNDAKKSSSLYNLFRTIFRNGFYGAISQTFLYSLQKLEKLLLNRKEGYKNQFDNFDLLSVVKNQIKIQPIVLERDFVFAFEEIDLMRIKKLNFDLLIKFSTGIFRGDILHAARLGIISIDYGDTCFNYEYRPGFWEVYSQRDNTEFSIRRLTDNLGGNGELIRGKLWTQSFYLLNQAALYKKSIAHLKILIERVSSQGELPPYLPSIPCSNIYYDTPKLHQTIYYLFVLNCRFFSKALYRLLGYQRRFGVSFVRSDWRNAELCYGVNLKNPPNHFLADPFVISRLEKDYCFVEDYNFTTERGCIAVYELNNMTSTRIGVAIEEVFHMSFPYLFEFQGDIYMCPETAENNDIRIYKCLDFPLRWELSSVAMKQVSAVDTMLFEKDGKWWMLTNIDHCNTKDYSNSLHIFYASSPLSTDWKAHPKNPIYADASLSRNGGLLRDGDSIFRVAQAPGFGIYGKKVSIRKIIELDEFNYIEELVSENTPSSFKNGIIGTHHFHSNGSITVFDYLFNSFVKN